MDDGWFAVSRSGLAKLVEKKGKVFALFELLSNAWDTKAKEVKVTFVPQPGVPKAMLKVEDDHPDGFSNMAHAFTLFAESEKKGDASKRGRFNLGEKLVLALCDSAVIESTKGTVTFDKDGRHESRYKREVGSMFNGVIRITRAEFDEALVSLYAAIPPSNIVTRINGEVLPVREPLHVFEATLPTEISDGEGVLRRTARKTEVAIYEPLAGETPSIYELGVPVVDTEDRWHVNVLQKVPLNSDRDNITPAFLRQVRTLVMNEMHKRLTQDDVNMVWVREATSNKDCSPEAVAKAMDLRFGEKRVAFDPSDPEANNLAVSKGYTVVYGGMLNKGEWENVKRSNAILPAGKVTPSPKPYNANGDPLKLIPTDNWTEGMKRTVEYAHLLAHHLLGVNIGVDIANDSHLHALATFGASRVLVLNVAKLGYRFFEKGVNWETNRLLIHEFGHDPDIGSLNHLDEKYHDALCHLGAKLADLTLKHPELFHDFRREES